MSGGHDHRRTNNARALGIALALTGGFMVAEVIAGFVFRSLALLSDAAHMLTDTVAIAIALFATHLAQRKLDAKRTFGYQRVETLSACFNALLLFGVAIYIVVEAVARLRKPIEVASVGMLVVAALGLLVNFVSLKILSTGDEKNLNVKGAQLEVWADLLGSVGAIAGAIAIRVTGWMWIDTVVAVGIGLWVLPRTYTLLRESVHVLMEGTPSDVEATTVRDALCAVPGVESIHELHIWSLAANQTSLSAHVVHGDADAETVLKAAIVVLASQFELRHVALQPERTACMTDSCGFARNEAHDDEHHPDEKHAHNEEV